VTVCDHDITLTLTLDSKKIEKKIEKKINMKKKVERNLDLMFVSLTNGSILEFSIETV